MKNLVIELSRYIIIIFTVMYTFYGFTVFRNNDKARQNKIFRNQMILIYLIHFICYALLYLGTENKKIIYLYLAEFVLFFLINVIYRSIYRNLSRLVFNHMHILLIFGLVMITRLSIDKAIRQLVFAAAALILCIIVPFIIDKFKALMWFTWLYAAAGILILAVVLLFGKAEFGATNWIKIGQISLQPSEFVKIIFVLFTASILSKSTDFMTVVKATVIAAIHVLILVLSKDLGGALIFFVTYLFMLYIASRQPFYFIAGLLSGSAASFVAYRLFAHVRIRVVAWKNPFQLIDNEGYQISQSLFAIGTGGWFGMGLTKGLPGSIPVVDSDFILSAISEEMGGIVTLCIILVCVSCYIMFVNISMKLKSSFYKLIAFGLGTMYIFQVFLTIGGITKFIPSTGVTLPLVSYGGSSIISTIAIFSIIQGLYVLNQDQRGEIELQTEEK